MLEEINRVPSDTVSVLYPLLLEKKINGHELGDGWAIGVTMNPDTMNYLVNALDDAMLDPALFRFGSTRTLRIISRIRRETGPDEDVLAFLRACPDMLLVTKKAADSTALYKSPTPRGWTKVQELRRSCAVGERLMRELIAGVVGPQAAAAFYGFLQDRGPAVPAARTVLECYEDAARRRARARQTKPHGRPVWACAQGSRAVFGPGRPDKERGRRLRPICLVNCACCFSKTLSARSEELTACFESTEVFASVAGIMGRRAG